jgi:hypothetical protein
MHPALAYTHPPAYTHPGAYTHPQRIRTPRSRKRTISRIRTRVRRHTSCIYAPSVSVNALSRVYTPGCAFTHPLRLRTMGRVNARWAAYTQEGPRIRRKGRVYAAWDPSTLDERCGAAADADDDGYRCEHTHDEDDLHRLLPSADVQRCELLPTAGAVCRLAPFQHPSSVGGCTRWRCLRPAVRPSPERCSRSAVCARPPQPQPQTFETETDACSIASRPCR